MSDATIDRPAGQPAPPISWGRRALDALDERLGLKGLQYPVPAHANTLAYSLGGLALITFVLMVATGIFLTQYYNPDPAVAHESVRHIITGVTLGSFMRAFHYWGAMAMIVLVGLHLLLVKRHAMAPSPFRKAAEPEPTRPFTRHLAELGALGLVLVGVLTLLVGVPGLRPMVWPPGVGARG